jgi:two-component system nitrate/nitrite response regulator NarL
VQEWQGAEAHGGLAERGLKRPPGSVTVVIADDHPIVRERLSQAIQEHEQLCMAGEASNGEEALELIRTTRPDVAVIDVFMPQMTGDQVLEALREERSRVKVLVLTAGPTAELYHTVCHQPDSLLYKDVGCREICEEIVAMWHGGHTSQGRVTLAQASLIAGTRPRLHSRELDALGHLAAGLLLQEIAARMGTSRRTVDEYLRLAREKLDVPTSAAAVARAYEMGHLRGRPGN